MFERKSSCERVAIHRNKEDSVEINEELPGKRYCRCVLIALFVAKIRHSVETEGRGTRSLVDKLARDISLPIN